MLVYLAGPITNVKERQAKHWRQRVAELLKGAGHGSYSPAHAWTLHNNFNVNETMRLQLANDAALAVCDLVLVAIADSVKSPGTDKEVVLARALGKETLVFPLAGTYRVQKIWVARYGLFTEKESFVASFAVLEKAIAEGFTPFGVGL